MNPLFKNFPSKKISNFFFGALLVLTLSSCNELVDFYIGIPLQPKLENKEFVPGLNILGILNPDSTGPYNNSFVHLEQILPAVGDTLSEIEVNDGLVEILKIDPVTADSLNLFSRSNPENLFQKDDYRPDSLFKPREGEVFLVRCTAAGLPVLTAITRIPMKPVIPQSGILISPQKINFKVLTDSSCHLLDVYLICVKNTLFKRIIPDPVKGVEISFSMGTNLQATELVICAYDRNLASYYTNSNISLNFNKYKRAYSLVENGYGVAGAVNVLRRKLP
jgi:hypothetical protein